MKKFLILIISIFSINCVFAIADIGLTQLLYASNSNLIQHNTLIITESVVAAGLSTTHHEENQRIRQKTVNAIKYGLGIVPQQLSQLLIESRQFQAYDAQPELMYWQKHKPQLITMWENESSITAIEGEVANDVHESTKDDVIATQQRNVHKIHKYILLGFIQMIRVQEQRQVIFKTKKISLLYSVKIVVQYKLIDGTTEHVVAGFSAHGHGGIARIIAHKDSNIQYDITDSVHDAISSLEQDTVRQLLIIKQQNHL